MEDSADVLIRLNNRVDHLEQRVFCLEHPNEATAASRALTSDPASVHEPHSAPAFSQTGSIFAVLGKAMLGMAGAYVLRAVAESGSVPKLATVSLAIAYAGTWLVFAARVPAAQWFASTIYAGTSALILAPMLWELTLRFKFLTPAEAAGLLAAFLLAAYILARKRNLVSIVWVAHLTTAIAAIALLTATHDMAAFIALLLFMALLSEFAENRSRLGNVRPVAAIAADIAVWAFIFTYSGPETSHSEYATLSTSLLLVPACALLLIYGTSVVIRTALQHETISVFEAMQAVFAFLLATDAVLHFATPVGVAVFGALCLGLSIAGYVATFTLFTASAARRNYQVYAAWSAALFLLGSFLCLNPISLTSILGAAALAATSIGARSSRLTLAFHGLLYLFAAAFTSGCLEYASHALAGAFPGAPSTLVWIIFAAAILCYIFGTQFSGTSWRLRTFQTFLAVIAVGALASILVSAIVVLAATVITPGAAHVAVSRTLTACLLAISLAFAGSYWQRVELVWVAYGTVALATAKLLFEDMRQGRPAFIAASIFLYALTLILVPRAARRSPRKLCAISHVEEPVGEPTVKLS